MRRDYTVIILFLLAMAGLVVRFIFLREINFSIDADEAIVGLMGKHMLEGAPIPAFYYGQHYMGSFEAILAGLFFSVVGVSSSALKAVPLLFSLLFILTVYFVTHTIAGKRAGILSATLATFPAQALMDWGVKARGGFIEVVVIGLFAVALLAPWFSTYSRKRLFLVGLVIGFGWWVNNQIIFFASGIGVAVFLAVCLANRPWSAGCKDFVVGLLGFVLGSLPFWWYNFIHDFASFEMFTQASSGKSFDYLKGLLTFSLPILGGAKKFYGSSDLFWGASVLFYLTVSMVVGGVFFAWREQKKTSISQKRLLEVLALIGIFTGIIFCLSSFGHLFQAPRYLLPLYAVWFPFVGIACDFFLKRRLWLGVALFMAVFGLQVTSHGFGSVPGEPLVFGRDRVMRDQTSVIDSLLRKNISLIRTDYWIGYKLAFESKEKIIFLTFGDPDTVRIPQYKAQALQTTPELLPMLISPSQKRDVVAGLNVQGISWEEEPLGDYLLLFNLKRSSANLVVPAIFHASVGEESLKYLSDSDRTTRYSSHAPQRAGMMISAQLSEPHCVGGIRYDVGAFEGDLPRSLRVSGGSRDGEHIQLISPVQYRQVFPFFKHTGVVTLSFPPRSISKIAFELVSDDSIRDWSIAELSLLHSEGCP